MAVAVASLGLVASALVAATPAQAADDLVQESDVATGQRPTTVLAASGSFLVARARETADSGVTQWSADGGATWQAWPDDFVPREPAAYVADGKAVWHELTDDGARFLRVVDLAALPDPGAIETYPVDEQPRAVTDTQMVLGESSAALYLVPLDGSPSAAIQLDGSTSPAKATHPRTTWVMRPAGLLYTTAWSSKAGGRSSYTDIDPVGPVDSDNAVTTFGPKPFRISGYVPYVNLMWKTMGTDGLAVIEYLQLSGKKLNLCTRDWNTTTGSLKSASCRKLTTTKKNATISAARHGTVLAITINGSERVWNGKKLVTVRAVKNHTIAFTGVGDTNTPLVQADRGVGGAIYRVTPSTGAVTKAFDYFTARVAPSALDLGLTSLAGLDGRAKQQGWVRGVDAAGIAPATEATDLAGATLGVQVSGARQAQRTSKSLVLSDHGVKTTTASAVSALTDASGPYTLVTRKKQTLVLGPTGAVVAKPSRKGNAIVAIYGSIVVEQNSGRTDILVRELTGKPGFPVSAKVPGAPSWKINRVLVHGDVVVVGVAYGSFRIAYAFDWRAREWTTEARNASPVALGDGVAAVFDYTRSAFALWDVSLDFNSARPGSKAIEDADTGVAPSFDGVGRLVYSTGTSLKLIDLHSWDGEDLVKGTAPRVLGTVAPTSYEVNAPGGWKLALDLSRPVTGEVEIVRGAGAGAGEVVAVLNASDHEDGAVRVSWDGTTTVDGGEEAPIGTLVPDGTYTWRFIGEGRDGTGSVRAINGDASARPGGTIRVYTATIKASRPTISGSLAVGKVLTARHSWSPSGLAYTYQWYASRVAIPDATEATYKLTPAERGKTISVRVTGTNRRGATATQTSKQTKAVGYGTLATKAPALTGGTPRVGQPVSVDPGAWAPAASFSYAWYRVNSKGKATAIKGATSDTYAPTAADRGYRLQVKVTGRAPGYKAATRSSGKTPKVATGVLVTAQPLLPKDAPVVGVEYAPFYDPWGPGTVSLGYAWYRLEGGTATRIAGATGPTYTPVGADEGKALRLTVTGTRTGFTTATVSVETPVVEPSP